MRKKFRVIMAGLVLACALTACVNNGGGGSETKGNIESKTEKKSDSGKEKKVEFSVGEADEDVYSNKMLGIKADVSSNSMELANNEELSSFDTGVKDRSDTAEVQDVLDKGGIFVDMYAYSTEHGMDSINIVIENTKKTTKTEDIDSYIDAVIPKLEAEFKKTGFSEVKVEKAKLTFLGEEVTGISTGLADKDIQQYQKQVFVQQGDYVATITSAAENEEQALAGIALFEKIE